MTLALSKILSLKIKIPQRFILWVFLFYLLISPLGEMSRTRDREVDLEMVFIFFYQASLCHSRRLDKCCNRESKFYIPLFRHMTKKGNGLY